MFSRAGQLLVRHWLPVWLAWVVVLVLVAWQAPPLDSVVKTGEFAFLPADSPSLVGEQLFSKAFPDDLLASSVVIVVRRTSQPGGLQEKDWDFVDDGVDDDDPTRDFELRERILRIAEEEGGLAQADEERPAAGDGAEKRPAPSIITSVTTYRDKNLGDLLKSADNKATLVIVGLTTEFLDAKNGETVHKIEQLLQDDLEFRRHIPAGLDISLSGTATVGRDMLVAQKDSARATEHLTVVLVVVLLIIIYRAPLLALIPLVTVVVSVKLTMSLLILGSERGLITLFQGVESYVTVLLYGAGVDYCLFLVARYKEELDEGASLEDAVSNAVAKVGHAITASAGTVICGIGMMVFAQFGKFREAGIAIAFGLAVVLLASMTFTPAMLRMTGRWAFWPQMRKERVSGDAGWIPSTPLSAHFGQLNWLQNTWDIVGRALLKRPGWIWLGTMAAMAPFAIVGALFYTHLSYGLLSDLPSNSPCVVGTKAVREHFAAGATGAITVLLKNDSVDFAQIDGEGAGLPAVETLTDALRDRKGQLQLADIRSASHPLGGDKGLDSWGTGVKAKLARDRAVKHYVSATEGMDGHVTRLDITAEMDPFARDSIGQLTRLEDEIRSLLPADIKGKTSLSVIGPTASIRDLKIVTDGDQIRIDSLVIGGVFLILVILLRKPAICAYLIVSVLFSYLVALGATYLFYWAMDPTEFAGLDWKVPMFLFTILIAVGEDYNIFLMTRIEEEQRRLGPVQGVVHALSLTGRIISSCGIIMAGTFASLMAGSLKGMSQLGFALAFGVLLDTFVVRPILVPSYLVLLHQGRFGKFGRWLGAQPTTPEPAPETQPVN